MGTLVILIYLFLYHCDTASAYQPENSACSPLTVPLCLEMPWNQTIYPNLLRHENQEEAGLEVHQFSPLVEIGCSDDLRLFLCSLYAPICTVLDHPIPPCKNLCMSARKGCEPVMNQFNFPWPEMFDCDKFPEDGLCIRGEPREEEDNVLEVRVQPEYQAVKEGGIATFACDATNPNADVYWTKNGKRITDNRNRYHVIETEHGVVLRIEPVKDRLDDATYECTAENSKTGKLVSKAVGLGIYGRRMQPEGFPAIVEHPDLRSYEVGSTAELPCSAIGDPNPSISWLKDLIPLDTLDPRIDILSNGNLRISGMRDGDEGTYECLAYNEHGVTYSRSERIYIRT